MTKIIYTLRQKAYNLTMNSEYKSVKLHGISCSRSDLEMVVFYSDTLLKQGNLNGLMEPSGNIKEVFAKVGLVAPYSF
jgi:hypothetical protein